MKRLLMTLVLAGIGLSLTGCATYVGYSDCRPVRVYHPRTYVVVEERPHYHGHGHYRSDRCD